MKKLEVPFVAHLQRASPMEQISKTLDGMLKHPINNAPWPAFNYVPEVTLSIAHGNNCLFLKYYVSEAVAKGAWFKPNDPVYRDSCVEFFIALDDKGYYNFEFNVIGTCLLNYGPNRNERIPVSEKLILSIRYSVTIQNKSGDDGKNGVYWELTLMIPTEIFSGHTITSLSGKKCRANFYKCGDDLPAPHFLCWNNIKSANPDFHLPEYFGEVAFL